MICTICQEDKPKTDFYANRHQCKRCFNKRNSIRLRDYWKTDGYRSYSNAKKQKRKNEAATKEIDLLYMHTNREEIYTACVDIDFIWDAREVKAFVRLWNDGFSIQHIAKRLQRPDLDVFMLWIDQYTQGEIKERRGGIYGTIGRMEAAE